MIQNSKKEWHQPSLEVLDVAQTMGGHNCVPDKNGKGGNSRDGCGPDAS